MSQEGQPRPPATTGIWPVMGGKDALDYIFIDIVPNAVLICWAIRGQPNRGLCRLCSTMAWMSSGEGPFGPGLPFRPAEYSRRYFRCLSRQWNFNSVEGRIITAARWI